MLIKLKYGHKREFTKFGNRVKGYFQICVLRFGNIILELKIQMTKVEEDSVPKYASSNTPPNSTSILLYM